MTYIRIIAGISIRGGAISVMQEANLTIINSRFINCKADVGAIIYSVNTLSVITFTNILVENSVVTEMALFYLLFSEIDFRGMTIKGNMG